jgi:hypothetical protein
MPDTAAPTAVPQRDRVVVVGVAGALVCQAILLGTVAFSNRDMLNPDGVSYIQLGYHYLKGEFGPAVSGYWGPLLTWSMVPLLAVGSDPLIAARIVMALSAVLFLLGSVSVFRALQLKADEIVVGAWIVALASVEWSVGITPDLLLCGLLCFAISRLLSHRWSGSRRIQLTAGLLFGAAYLAKAVALPGAVGVTLAIGVLWVLTDPARWRSVSQGALVTLVGLLIVAGPWIVVLSSKYRRFVFSTSGPVAHAISGPADVDRSPGIKTFHTPEPGRRAAWEDPPTLRYVYWSPFESREYFKYQIGLIYHNGRTVADFLSGFDFLHLGLVAALCGLLIHTPWRDNIARERWRWAALPIACLSASYLPTYAGALGDQRYYYGTYPFLIAASLGLVTSLTRNSRMDTNVPRIVGIGVVALSFLQVPILTAVKAAKGFDVSPTTNSRDLAMKLRALGRDGGIAARCQGEVPVSSEVPPEFVAFFMNQVYHGCEPNPSVTSVKHSGAKLILVGRGQPLGDELARDPGFQDLDSLLFESHEDAARFPWRVFEMRTP